jgi:predicted transposase/invertase (TIGR01784 family)
MYWSREYVKDMESGDDYKTLPNVITINIVNFDYIPLEAYHTSFHIREDKHPDYILTDALEIHFINMVKFRELKEKDIKNDYLERWLTFLDETTPLEVIEEIKQMDAAIRKTAEKLDFVSRDKEALRLYHLREMGMSDLTTAINTAVEKAEIRVKQEIQLEYARNALRAGVSVELVSAFTGLDIDAIKSLQ